MKVDTTRVEYMSFQAGETAREYRLHVHRGEHLHVFTVAIANEAFLSGRARYQDAPEICFLKVLRELEDCTAGALPPRAHRVTDEELAEYQVAHTPKTPRRRL